MDVKPSTIWAMVTLVAIMMGGAIALRVLGEEITIILALVSTLALPVLGIFGAKIHENIQEVRTQTNGNIQRQAEFNQENQKAMQENVVAFQKAMQENIVALQATVTDLALRITPPKETDDNASSVHIP